MKNYATDLVSFCIKNNINVNLAESCTGGLISSKLIDVAGASRIFKFGVISYSNESKNLLLKVPKSILNKYGAVSEETASSMVEKLSNFAEIQFSMAVTGIAGPGGGTRNKPIGLVYHSFYYKKSKKKYVIKKKYKGNRNKIRNAAALFSIYQSYIILKSTI